MVYLGGMGSLSGSVLSAILFTLVLELLRPLQIIKWVVVPLLLFLLMLFRPEGLLGQRGADRCLSPAETYFRFEGGEVMPLFEVQGLNHFFGGLKAVKRLQSPWRGGTAGPDRAQRGGQNDDLQSGLRGLPPFQGEVRMEGGTLKGLYPHQVTASGIARTFQNIRLWPEMTVLDNIRSAQLSSRLRSSGRLAANAPLPGGGGTNQAQRS